MICKVINFHNGLFYNEFKFVKHNGWSRFNITMSGLYWDHRFTIYMWIECLTRHLIKDCGATIQITKTVSNGETTSIIRKYRFYSSAGRYFLKKQKLEICTVNERGQQPGPGRHTYEVRQQKCLVFIDNVMN